MTFGTIWHAFFGHEKRLITFDRRRPVPATARVAWSVAFPDRRVSVRRAIDREEARQRGQDA